MADILHDQQRIVEKDLLGFALADIVLFDTLASILRAAHGVAACQGEILS